MAARDHLHGRYDACRPPTSSADKKKEEANDFTGPNWNKKLDPFSYANLSHTYRYKNMRGRAWVHTYTYKSKLEGEKTCSDLNTDSINQSSGCWIRHGRKGKEGNERG